MCTNKAPLTEINLIQDRGATCLTIYQTFFSKILPKNFLDFGFNLNRTTFLDNLIQAKLHWSDTYGMFYLLLLLNLPKVM